ncbi:MAG: right-handed parallel beta-helix repeat-containing protein [Opitutaceae bacterium]|jgi:parallel beta-helix repeat protein
MIKTIASIVLGLACTAGSICAGIGLSTPGEAVASATAPDEADLQSGIDAAVARGEKRFVIPAGVHRLSSALRLRDLHDFTFEGPSPQDSERAVLIFTELTNGGIAVRDCSQLIIRGFTIDFDPLPFTQGTIDAINRETGTLTYTVHEGYPDLSPRLISNRAHIFDSQTLAWKSEAPDIYADSGRAISPRRAVLTFGPANRWQLDALLPGDYIVQNIRHEQAALRVELTTDITLSHVGIRSAPGLAMVFRFVDGQNRFDHIVIAPGPTPDEATIPRLLSTSADGFNYAYARTGPILENCDFSRMGDDSVNIHGIAFAVAEVGVDSVDGPYVTLIRPYGQEAFPSVMRVGDQVHGLSQGNFDIIGETTIRGISPARSADDQDHLRLATRLFPLHGTIRHTTLYRLRLDEPLALSVGDFIEIPAIAAPGYVIKNNRFTQHRGRALRLMSSHGVIEDNLIDGIKQAPITLGPEFVGFREAGWVSDIVVRGNIIKNSAFDPIMLGAASFAPGAISVIYRGEAPDSPSPVNARHRGIRIENNTIENVGGPGIHINQAADVLIKGNTLRNTNQVPGASQGNRYGLTTSHPIDYDHSEGVMIEP